MRGMEARKGRGALTNDKTRFEARQLEPVGLDRPSP